MAGTRNFRWVGDRGFSIIELMTVVAIIAIFLAYTIPSFQDAIRNNRLAAQANEFIAGFTLARTEAVRRNGRVAVCPADTTTSPPTCGTDWAQGMAVWADTDNDGAVGASEELIRVFPPMSLEDSLTTSAAIALVRFDGRGLTTMATNSTLTFTMQPVTCPTGKGLVRQFALNQIGRIGVVKGYCP